MTEVLNEVDKLKILAGLVHSCKHASLTSPERTAEGTATDMEQQLKEKSELLYHRINFFLKTDDLKTRLTDDPLLNRSVSSTGERSDAAAAEDER